jgi:hypothetical protein
MDDSFTLFAWTLGGTAAFALLGGLFGALAGWMSWRGGSASGTAMGRKVADALARLAEDDVSDSQRAALTGAADGALFLGVFGMLFGLIAGRIDAAPGDWLVPVFAITVGLAVLAVAFGLLAAGIVRLRMPAIVGLSIGGVGGGLLAAHHAGVVHIVPGAAVGILLGTLVGALFPKS